jgi:hypothetical protein
MKSLNFDLINSKINYFIVVIFVIFLSLLAISSSQAREPNANQISFEDITKASGFINHKKATYGVAWADANGDSWPDVWVNNHICSKPTLYINQKNGTFKGLSSTMWTEIKQKTVQLLQRIARKFDILKDSVANQIGYRMPHAWCADFHGAAWADFDDDGDQDLVQLAGGGRGVGRGTFLHSNRLFRNEAGKFQEQARELGIDYPLARGRTPLWFDFNNDGKLDLFVGATKRPDGKAPPTIFHQMDEAFKDYRASADFDLASNDYALLSDLSGDGLLDALFIDSGDSSKVLDFKKRKVNDLTYLLNPHQLKGDDAVSADFNGDLLPDLYLTRSEIYSEIVQISSNILKVSLDINDDEKGLYIKTEGNIIFDVEPKFLKHNNMKIYIGKEGFHPAIKGSTWNIWDRWRRSYFTLSHKDPKANGLLRHSPGTDKGIYVGYDEEVKMWKVVISSPEKIYSRIQLETQKPILKFQPIGVDLKTRPRPDSLLVHSQQGFEDQSEQSGINKILTPGVSVVAGDFDNDMDLDLYIVATSPVKNRPNVLYENLGDGTFKPVPEAGGASGTGLGVGDSATTVDYDKDGFLDLFVANGRGPGFSIFESELPYQLFHNQGNSNHWLEIDLEGKKSNRDAIGAQVLVTAGGVTQLREQAGGMHISFLIYKRLHFGLGDHLKVDTIVVRWPSGIIQHIKNVSADKLIHIVEPPASNKS